MKKKSKAVIKRAESEARFDFPEREQARPKGKLSRRITWRVIGIILFFNVLIIGAILGFVFIVSLMNSSSRGQYVVDGVEGKIESMLWAVHIAAANNRDEIERNLESPEQVFDALEREINVNHFMGC